MNQIIQIILLTHLCTLFTILVKYFYYNQLQGTPGVTGSVMWDSGVVLGKFLEHAMESGMIDLQGKKVVELGSGCGLVG